MKLTFLKKARNSSHEKQVNDINRTLEGMRRADLNNTSYPRPSIYLKNKKMRKLKFPLLDFAKKKNKINNSKTIQLLNRGNRTSANNKISITVKNNYLTFSNFNKGNGIMKSKNFSADELNRKYRSVANFSSTNSLIKFKPRHNLLTRQASATDKGCASKSFSSTKDYLKNTAVGAGVGGVLGTAAGYGMGRWDYMDSKRQAYLQHKDPPKRSDVLKKWMIGGGVTGATLGAGTGALATKYDVDPKKVLNDIYSNRKQDAEYKRLLNKILDSRVDKGSLSAVTKQSYDAGKLSEEQYTNLKDALGSTAASKYSGSKSTHEGTAEDRNQAQNLLRRFILKNKIFKNKPEEIDTLQRALDVFGYEAVFDGDQASLRAK